MSRQCSWYQGWIEPATYVTLVLTRPAPSVTLMLTSSVPGVTLMLTSPGPHVALMLTSPGPHVIIVYQEEHLLSIRRMGSSDALRSTLHLAIASYAWRTGSGSHPPTQTLLSRRCHGAASHTAHAAPPTGPPRRPTCSPGGAICISSSLARTVAVQLQAAFQRLHSFLGVPVRGRERRDHWLHLGVHSSVGSLTLPRCDLIWHAARPSSTEARSVPAPSAAEGGGAAEGGEAYDGVQGTGYREASEGGEAYDGGVAQLMRRHTLPLSPPLTQPAASIRAESVERRPPSSTSAIAAGHAASNGQRPTPPPQPMLAAGWLGEQRADALTLTLTASI